MAKRVRNTTFVSRGRLTGLVRDEAPAGIGQNRTTRKANRDNGQEAADDDGLFYRARLVLGDSLPRPER
jgi:hypothetical protein